MPRGSVVSAQSPPTRFPDFALADQFGRDIDDQTYSGAPLIVVVGNRDGARGVALWTASLRAAIGEVSDTRVLPVADLKGVPRMLRKLVGRLLPRDPAHWCALDWDGQLGAPIRQGRAALVAAAFGANRQLRVWTALPPETVESATMATLVAQAESS